MFGSLSLSVYIATERALAFPWRPVNNKSFGHRSVYGHLPLESELGGNFSSRRRMRDLIVKINTDPAVVGNVGANQQTTNRSRLLTVDNSVGSINTNRRATRDVGLSLTVRSLREDDALSTDDGSDSGTAGTPTSQTAGYWPDLEVLDPDHPM